MDDSTHGTASPDLEEALECAEAAAIEAHNWREAVSILHKLLESSGCVSSTVVKKELEQRQLPDPPQLITELRTQSENNVTGSSTAGFRYFHSGRSFYTEAAFQEHEKQTEEEAAKAEVSEARDAPVATRRKRQEEARLVTYVRSALDELYWSDHGPEDHDYVFDVHNERSGGEFENVDLVAVHWRSNRHVDLVSVEVKLELSVRLAQQASNYLRFSDRVWIAVPVKSEPAGAAIELRDQNPRLFEYVLHSGFGVLGCRRTTGRRYTVVPLQWPRRNEVDPVERDAFIERHRPCFERAGVIPPAGARGFPIRA